MGRKDTSMYMTSFESPEQKKSSKLDFSRRNSPVLLFAVCGAIFMPRTGDIGDDFVAYKAGKGCEYLACHIRDLFHAGVDVHIVQPYFRRIMTSAHRLGEIIADLPASRVHLACDRVFYYAGPLDENADWLNLRISAAFQREVMYRWIPEIAPDLVLCHDWMAGLIPAAASSVKLPSVFSFGRMSTRCVPLWSIEDIGLDTAPFWKQLYYRHLPGDYAQTRQYNCADLLLSGIHGATIVSAVGTEIAQEVSMRLNHQNSSPLRRLLHRKIKQRIVCSSERKGCIDDCMALYQRAFPP